MMSASTDCSLGEVTRLHDRIRVHHVEKRSPSAAAGTVVVKQTCVTDSVELCLDRMSPPLKADSLVAICKDGGY